MSAAEYQFELRLIECQRKERAHAQARETELLERIEAVKSETREKIESEREEMRNTIEMIEARAKKDVRKAQTNFAKRRSSLNQITTKKSDRIEREKNVSHGIC